MKNLTIILTSILLALGLPSAAFADVEISVEAEDSDGDQLQVSANGPNVNNLEGWFKIKCESTGNEATVEIVESNHDGCIINLLKDGVNRVSIHVCEILPRIYSILDAGCEVIVGGEGEEGPLEVSIEVELEGGE